MTVVMMGQMSLDNSVEKSEKKNDYRIRLTEWGRKFIAKARRCITK